MVDLCLFVPLFPAFFDLLISFGQNGLIICGPNLEKWPKQAGVLVHTTKSLQNLNIEKKTRYKNDVVLTYKSQNAYLSGSNLLFLFT